MKSDRASSTAKVIAAGTILLAAEGCRPDPVAPGAVELCEGFLSGNPADRLLAASARHPLGRRFWRLVERATLPGIIAHYWRRKRWIEDRCRSAIAEGFERIVVIGAGFDTLGIRLAREIEGIEVIELDHPATQSAKRAALLRHEMTLPENLRFSPIDLTQELPAILSGHGRATVFILEGVLMYLPESDVSRLLHALPSISPGRSRVIFSFMSRWPDGGSGFRPGSSLIESWLAWKREPFAWCIEPAAIANFLAAHDFDLVEVALTRELFDGTAAPGDRLEGENLVVCTPR